ncbi:MAG: MFS transporter [Gemmataceae bacterium]
MNESIPPAPPSRARIGVLAFLCTLTFVLYLDRVCIAQALPRIRDDLGLSLKEGAYVLMAFQLAYGLFEVPTGHWGDRIGSRAVLTRIAVWWSLFTALTAACTGLYSLLAVRFLFGVGEAGALPNVARVVARWFPQPERGRVTGIVQTTMVLGGATSPLLAAYIIESLGCRWAFVLFGTTGVVWAAFFRWFRDDPAQHPQVNPGELAALGDGGSGGVVHREGIPWQRRTPQPEHLAARRDHDLQRVQQLRLPLVVLLLPAGRPPRRAGRGGPVGVTGAGGAAGGMFLGGFVADLFARLRCDERVGAASSRGRVHRLGRVVVPGNTVRVAAADGGVRGAVDPGDDLDALDLGGRASPRSAASTSARCSGWSTGSASSSAGLAVLLRLVRRPPRRAWLLRARRAVGPGVLRLHGRAAARRGLLGVLRLPAS